MDELAALPEAVRRRAVDRFCRVGWLNLGMTRTMIIGRW